MVFDFYKLSLLAALVVWLAWLLACCLTLWSDDNLSSWFLTCGESCNILVILESRMDDSSFLWIHWLESDALACLCNCVCSLVCQSHESLCALFAVVFCVKNNTNSFV